MKKFLLITVFCFSFLAMGLSQTSFGGGITYFNDIGIQARASFGMDKLTVIPKASYYFTSGATSMAFDVDLALNVATISDENPLYVYAGPRLWRVSVLGFSSSEIALNFGAGARFGNIFVEAGYSLFFCDGCGGEIGFTAGYMF